MYRRRDAQSFRRPRERGARLRRPPAATLSTLALALACLTCVPACGGGASGVRDGAIQPPAAGAEVPRPDGRGTFFVDAHSSGNATRLRLVGVEWGRLVDVYDVDRAGKVSADPVFEDFLIGESVIGDGVDYVLETNPLTFQTRLVILRTKGAGGGLDSFEALLARASSNLPPVLPRTDDGSAPPPVSLVPRNAAVALLFDDLLADDGVVERNLASLVQLRVGYPPIQPMPARLFFDPNHGGIAGGAFHSTRVIVDFTITEAEASEMPAAVGVNVVGLPASRTDTNAGNVSLRVPSVPSATHGQFEVVRSLGGAPIAPEESVPYDPTSPTLDVVRAFRSGGRNDVNAGFLFDVAAPEIVGSWRLAVESVTNVSSVEQPQRYEFDVRFETPCATTPQVGDGIAVGTRFFEVTSVPNGLTAGLRVPGLVVRLLAGPVPTSESSLLGMAEFRTLYDRALDVLPGCWLTLIPEAASPPTTDVSIDTSVVVRFSEPMNPITIRAFDTLRLVRGNLLTPARANTIVVAEVSRSRDLREYILTPTLPLDHRDQNEYRFELPLYGVRDLAGNVLAEPLPAVLLSVGDDEPPESNGGIAMRFAELDEIEPLGALDFRGQAEWDPSRELLIGRPVDFQSSACDEKTGTVQIMTPFAPGVQTPLSPLGSRLASVWRYADFGWDVRDESKLNLDVVGLAWRPALGTVVADFFPEFEMSLAHSYFLPDERCPAGPAFPDSGLGDNTIAFTGNVLVDPLSPQRVVHRKDLGYRFDSTDVFLNENGTPMVPFPMNVPKNAPGEPLQTFTWRDTSVLAPGGPLGVGVPMSIETGPPLNVPGPTGSVYGAGKVRAIGLPLLWEIKCYPTSSGIGLNPLTIKVACLLWPKPNFRAYSTGGINSRGDLVTKNPDDETFPSGGFNPSAGGRPTAFVADNSFYEGQLDWVARVSRTHTVWIDTANNVPDFEGAIIEPQVSDQPAGTRLVIEYRGADSFLGFGKPFDASGIDPYGDLRRGNVVFHPGSEAWTEEVDLLDGSRYFQVRFTFISNLATGDRATLDSFGIAFRGD